MPGTKWRYFFKGHFYRF